MPILPKIQIWNMESKSRSCLQVKKACPAELTRYAMCLEKSDYMLKYSYCRETGEAYNACMKEKLGMETPHFGYHALVKVHQSDRYVHG